MSFRLAAKRGAFALSLIALLTLGARRADAADERAPDPSTWGLRLDVAPGLRASSGSAFSFFDFGATGVLRWHWLDLGALADASGNFTSEGRAAYGALAGAGGMLGAFGAFDLLAEGGAHVYSGIGGCAGDGCGLGDPGVGGTVPYVGARASIAYLGGSPDPDGSLRFLFGLWVYFNRDLASEMVTYEAKSQEIGGASEVGLALRIGANASWL